MVFCDWLLPLNVRFSRFLYIVVLGNSSFLLLLNDIPFYDYYIFAYQLMVFNLFLLFSYRNNAAMDVHIRVFVWI